ncbi:toll/interleukin-1 receptor domain-containing protein [Dactylosporangium sp. NPDC006015]|uniref:toll/interleukin-1 receptor domain-containing protein n=1 Tax=Dactylosporangium sp. NPDC006015 TaxID=3154576 RepID=UPI0033A2C0A1
MNAPGTDAPSTRIFCSYRRADDADLFNGVVRNLVRDLRSYYKADTGQTLEIFLDRDELRWGDDFESAISQAVQDAAFFMPIITANYFESEWCRKEFYGFYSKAQSLGVAELILPVVLAGSHLISSSGSDSIARIIATIQHFDWSDPWQQGADSAAWRTAITRMVQRIRELQDSAEARLTANLLSDSTADSADPTDHQAGGRPAEGARDRETGQVLSEVVVSFADVSKLASDAVALLAAMDEGLRQIPSDSANSRLERARFSADFGPKAVALDRRAADAVGQALDIDVRLRRMYSEASANGRSWGSEDLKREIRQGSQAVGSAMDDLVPVSSAANRLRGPGLKTVSIPISRLIQSLRDLSLLIDRWETWL